MLKDMSSYPPSSPRPFLRNVGRRLSQAGLLLLGASALSASAGSYQLDPVKGRIVRIEVPGPKKTLHVSEVQVFSGGKNVALSRPATMSSQFSNIAKYSPSGAVDMGTNLNTGPRSAREESPWLEIDLGKAYEIDRIVLYRASSPLRDYEVKIGMKKGVPAPVYSQTVSTKLDVISLSADAEQQKELGAIWTIGDQVSLGDQDADAETTPRSVLHQALKADGYQFSLVGHLTTQAEGLPADAAYTGHSTLSGATISDVAAQLDTMWGAPALQSSKPSTICLMLGTNDIHTDKIDGAPERMKSLIDQIYALPGIGSPTILLGAIPPNQTVERRKTNVNIYNEALQTLAAKFQMEQKNVLFVDHFNALGGENTDRLKANMQADSASENGVGTDLNARGNAITGALWANALVSNVLTEGTDTLPWAFPKANSVRALLKHAPGYIEYTVTTPTGQTFKIIPPKPGVTHKSGKKPWLWRNIFYSSNTGQSMKTDLKLLEEGYSVVNVYGSVVGHPRGNQKVKAVYDYLTQEQGYAPTFSASAMSRGGFMVIRYAYEYPDHIEGILMDNACSNGLSWPAGKPFAGEYEYAPGKTYAGPGSKASFELYTKEYDEFDTLDQATEYLRTNSPIHLLEPLAKSGVKILSICGDSDHAVPYEENDAILEKMYKELGGDIEVIVEKKGHKHGQLTKETKDRFYNFVRENTFRVPN